MYHKQEDIERMETGACCQSEHSKVMESTSNEESDIESETQNLLENVVGEHRSNYEAVVSNNCRPTLNDEESRHKIRPCYLPLRIFGLWHPAKFSRPIRWIHLFCTTVIFSTCCGFVLYLDVLHNKGWENMKPLEIINSFCTIIDFLGPFTFTIYYFWQDHFNELMKVLMVSHENIRLLVKWRRWYNILSAILWILCALFFYFHWLTFYTQQWHHGVYAVVVALLGGYWSTWLSVYAFICAAHCVDLTNSLVQLNQAKDNQPYRFGEKEMAKFMIMHDKSLLLVMKSQSCFNFMISASVAYHVVDIAVFSSAFWQHDYGSDYPVAQYLGTLAYDLSTIFIKVYPAGRVVARTNILATRFSQMCSLEEGTIDKGILDPRMAVYRYLRARNEDIGFKILGVRITQNIAYAIIATIATATLTFVSAISRYL